MSEHISGKILVAGNVGKGVALVLSEPISFWGGVDPKTGEIINRHHPQCGTNISGTVLCLPGTIGSSSGSSIMLELVHARKAPAAILIDHPDAILLLGLITAHEMGWPHPTALQVSKSVFSKLEGRTVVVGSDGKITAY